MENKDGGRMRGEVKNYILERIIKNHIVALAVSIR
jgi:hypothetical protein